MVRDLRFDAATFRHARISAGYSRVELAALLGVSKQTVKSWEAGRRTPTPERLDDAAALLRVEPAALNGRTDSQRLDLQGLRETAGLSVRAAARRLGIDPKTVRRVEAGQRPPPDPARMRGVYHVADRTLAAAIERSWQRSDKGR